MAPASDTKSGGGGCPIKSSSSSSGSSDSAEVNTAMTGPPFASLFGIPRTLEQIKTGKTEGGHDGGGGCPVKEGGSTSCTTAAAMPSPLNPLNNERLYPQVPITSQRIKLSTEREISSIPKGDFTPKHQPQGSQKWIYPSEQQYYNAMKSKGFDPQEQDVGIILAIHNAVNEQGWKEVLEWEREYGDGSQPPKLKRFMGRPTEMSPKARLLWLMGYNKPFDRHDWVVERADGKEVRYVIDFYSGVPQSDKPVSMHLDVRPALDSTEALQWRLTRQMREWKDSILDTGGSSSSESTSPSSSSSAPSPS